MGEWKEGRNTFDTISEASCVVSGVDAGGEEVEQNCEDNCRDCHRIDTGGAIDSETTQISVFHRGGVPDHEAGENEEDRDGAFGPVEQDRGPSGSEITDGEVPYGNGKGGEKTNDVEEDGWTGCEIFGPGELKRGLLPFLRHRSIQNRLLHRNGDLSACAPWRADSSMIKQKLARLRPKFEVNESG